jgi:hypothetical protein
MSGTALHSGRAEEDAARSRTMRPHNLVVLHRVRECYDVTFIRIPFQGRPTGPPRVTGR